MTVRRRSDEGVAQLDLPPESAAAHFDAIAKGLSDVDIVVQGLLNRVAPVKPWQRQLLSQLAEADRHIEILRLTIALERDTKEISAAAAQLEQGLQIAYAQLAGGRADGWTKSAVQVALHVARLLDALLAP